MKDTAQATFIACVIYISAVFGGIIAANYAIREGGARRFMSFLYGFAWYPMSFAYAVYDPPEWYATIYPFVEGPPGFFSYPKPTVPQLSGHLHSGVKSLAAHKMLGGGVAQSKGSLMLRIMSGLLLLCNAYVIFVLINARFFVK